MKAHFRVYLVVLLALVSGCGRNDKIKLKDMDARQLTIVGDHAAGAGKHLDAVQFYTMALEKGEASLAGHIHNNRGLANQALGEFEKALQDFNAAIASDPTFLRAYLNRGGVQFQKGELELALEDCNHALELAPSSPEVLRNRALVFRKMGKLEEAAADEEKASSLPAP